MNASDPYTLEHRVCRNRRVLRSRRSLGFLLLWARKHRLQQAGALSRIQFDRCCHDYHCGGNGEMIAAGGPGSPQTPQATAQSRRPPADGSLRQSTGSKGDRPPRAPRLQGEAWDAGDVTSERPATRSLQLVRNRLWDSSETLAEIPSSRVSGKPYEGRLRRLLDWQGPPRGAVHQRSVLPIDLLEFPGM
jgi:hypothetical protein